MLQNAEQSQFAGILLCYAKVPSMEPILKKFTVFIEFLENIGIRNSQNLTEILFLEIFKILKEFPRNSKTNANILKKISTH